MSVHIVDRIEAIRFPAAAIGHYEDVFLVMELGGDNNCTNARTGRRAKSWSATCIGPDWVVIGDYCRYAELRRRFNKVEGPAHDARKLYPGLSQGPGKRYRPARRACFARPAYPGANPVQSCREGRGLCS